MSREADSGRNEPIGRLSSLDRLGERIRAARIAAGLTQEQLAGGDITRNMLSRIETGAALPSLPTLCALAERLDVPAGALLGDLSDYTSYRLAAELKGLLAKKRYAALLEVSRASDVKLNDELCFILCEASVGRAVELFRDGRLTEALSLLDDAGQYSEKTIFDTSAAMDRAMVCRMLAESATQPPSRDPEGDDEALRRLIFAKNSAAIYIWARNMLCGAEGKAYSVPDENAALYRSRLEPIISELPEGFMRSHIEAKLDMVSAEYLGAKARLVPYLDDPSRLPPTLLFDLYTDVELCCKCCGDFENAYRYSTIKLALLQKIR